MTDAASSRSTNSSDKASVAIGGIAILIMAVLGGPGSWPGTAAICATFVASISRALRLTGRAATAAKWIEVALVAIAAAGLLRKWATGQLWL